MRRSCLASASVWSARRRNPPQLARRAGAKLSLSARPRTSTLSAAPGTHVFVYRLTRAGFQPAALPTPLAAHTRRPRTRLRKLRDRPPPFA